MDNSLGDKPIEGMFKSLMIKVVRMLDSLFNGDLRGDKRRVGFILLVFNYGEKAGRCNYVSNGANRDDVCKMLEEQVKRFKESIVEKGAEEQKN